MLRDHKRWGVTLLAFALGLSFSNLFRSWIPSRNTDHPQLPMSKHWEKVDEYRQSVRTPRQEIRVGNLTGFREPFDPTPHLDALVHAKQLDYIDLVIPTVPALKEFNRHWMTKTWEDPDFVHANGNHFYSAYETKGQQPVHLQLWIKPDAQPKVQRLIRELEAMASNTRVNVE